MNIESRIAELEREYEELQTFASSATDAEQIECAVRMSEIEAELLDLTLKWSTCGSVAKPAITEAVPELTDTPHDLNQRCVEGEDIEKKIKEVETRIENAEMYLCGLLNKGNGEDIRNCEERIRALYARYHDLHEELAGHKENVNASIERQCTENNQADLKPEDKNGSIDVHKLVDETNETRHLAEGIQRLYEKICAEERRNPGSGEVVQLAMALSVMEEEKRVWDITVEEKHKHETQKDREAQYTALYDRRNSGEESEVAKRCLELAAEAVRDRLDEFYNKA